MCRRSLSVVLGLLAATAAVTSSAQASTPRGNEVRLNELQVIGTHNSYHRETSEREQDAYDALISTPGDYDAFLKYSHAGLPQQFARQVRARTRARPVRRPPGRSVRRAARAQASWPRSAAHPEHVPIPILLELKRSDARAVAQGGVVAPAWDRAALDALDDEIRSVFAEREMITPDDVRSRGETLEQSVRSHGWPRLRRSRGQVLFLLDNDPGAIRDAYVAGRPSLEGRVLFTNSRPGLADAAFIKRNEPRGPNTAQIAELVRLGYYVRTRSDVPLQTVRANDTSMLEAALVSGAQVVSTDFPEIGMSARYDSDFVATLPGGGPARCNPVNTPRGCRSERLEGRG